ncbi:hypothetical protein Lalb_Chr02g0149811 [Lupinus albus]|uniref:Uncharacterized protein n=1 Tax=Lupinus albus TaxID=3870 RepID=A0A6A4QZ67_LUPAL|nr:hypothetical protein Lalb_Chr02g0149811 [Lupinus albus]
MLCSGTKLLVIDYCLLLSCLVALARFSFPLVDAQCQCIGQHSYLDSALGKHA